MGASVLIRPVSCVTCERTFRTRGAFFEYGDGIVECRSRAACEARAGRAQTYYDRAVPPPYNDERVKRYGIWLDGHPTAMQCAHRPIVGKPLYVTRQRGLFSWREIFIDSLRQTSLLPPLDVLYVARNSDTVRILLDQMASRLTSR